MARVSDSFLKQYATVPFGQYGKVCVVVVDMINGFEKEGALADPKIMEIIPAIETLLKQGGDCVFVADTHEPNALEFRSYPPHCLKDSEESEVVAPLQPYVKTKLTKNSTCTFTSPNWQAYYAAHQNDYDTFVIVGCCTDICILQFALTLRAYLNEKQIDQRVVVPISMIDTYHIDQVHDAYACNAFAIANMAGNAVEVVKDFTY